MRVVESKIFLVRSNTNLYPLFYVTAEDILAATELAKKIVGEVNDEKVVSGVSVFETPLLSLGEDE